MTAAYSKGVHCLCRMLKFGLTWYMKVNTKLEQTVYD